MPYIGLEEQGFFEPFRAIERAGNNYRERRRQKAEDAERSLDAAARRKYLEAQIGEIGLRSKREEEEANFTPDVVDRNGVKFARVGRGRYEVIKPEPENPLTRAFKLMGGQSAGQSGPVPETSPMSPGDPAAPSGPTPAPAQPGGALPNLDFGGRKYRVGLAPDGNPRIEPEPQNVEPEVVEKTLPDGSRAPFLRTVDPQSGEVKLSPYNRPDAAGKISERTVTQANIEAARRYAQQLKDVIGRHGNYENSLTGDPNSLAAMKQIPYLLAISLAKVLDPGSVAREGEVAAAQKFLIPMGLLTKNSVSVAAIDRLMNDLETRTRDLGLAETPAGPPGAAPQPAAPAGPRKLGRFTVETFP